MSMLSSIFKASRNLLTAGFLVCFFGLTGFVEHIPCTSVLDQTELAVTSDVQEVQFSLVDLQISDIQSSFESESNWDYLSLLAQNRAYQMILAVASKQALAIDLAIQLQQKTIPANGQDTDSHKFSKG